MDELPSSEFRRRYAALREDTLVTVNGHVIGKWTPIGSARQVVAAEEIVQRLPERYDTRPFTPVPKKR